MGKAHVIEEDYMNDELDSRDDDDNCDERPYVVRFSEEDALIKDFIFKGPANTTEDLPTQASQTSKVHLVPKKGGGLRGMSTMAQGYFEAYETKMIKIVCNNNAFISTRGGLRALVIDEATNNDEGTVNKEVKINDATSKEVPTVNETNFNEGPIVNEEQPT
ncbi:unnamed protein product [Vicia faba]|uniref:Uncharacterized protein n=1 Tax=Vicia faba TaxID=3906 RepID=A0AAV1B5S9_VICFA|nr:unnamed protein product [Vicia faba]